jgi:hypothetical protein
VLLVADNKTYLQNAQGMKLKDETRPIDTIMREVKEEVGLDMRYDRFVKIGYWSFNNVVELVDTEFESKTILYGLRVREITPGVTKVINDEIEFTVGIAISELANFPSKIEGKTFSGHHRQALYDFFEIDKKERISYLSGYQVWGLPVRK